MAIDGLDDAAVAALLTRTRRVAMVGASPRADRPSNGVMQFLLRHGWDVVPVNPAAVGHLIHGRIVVGSLAEAGGLDMVDIFRASDQAGAAVDEAIALGARSVWLQLGVVDEAAAGRARAAGLTVVMDRCPAIEAPRLRAYRHGTDPDA